MKSQIQFGLAVAGCLYFSLVLASGFSRYIDSAKYVEELQEGVGDLQSLGVAVKPSRDDPISMFRRCVDIQGQAMVQVGNQTVLQFQTIQAAASEQVLHGGLGAGLFALMALFSWRTRRSG